MQHVIFFLALVLLLPGPGLAETIVATSIKPVCGNLENGIVIGKPKLFDERTLALLIDSLQARLSQLASIHANPAGISETLPEQTQLTAQLTNLRSLSERALSDRVLLSPSTGGAPAIRRAQALVGFQISVDPGQKYQHAVAEVEITVSSRASQDPLTVVSVLPKDHTYDVATVTPEEQPFGVAVPLSTNGGGPVKQALYLVRDADTVALERVSPSDQRVRGCMTAYKQSPRDVTMAWQFKSVFGRESVDPGMRQVYALLALPTAATDDFEADVHVDAYWRPLQQNPKPSRFSKQKNAPDLQEASFREEFWPDAIRYNPTEMELALRPRVTNVHFVYEGGDDVLVLADGENFLADTRILAGDTTVAPPDLTIERERHLQFAVPAQALIQHPAYLTGRFGAPVPLLDPLAPLGSHTDDPAWGLKIESARARPKDAEQSEVRIKLKSRERKKPLAEFIVNKTLVSAIGKIYAVSSAETDPTDSEALLVRFEAPTAKLRTASRVTVARLFGGDLYRDSAELTLEDDISAAKVALLAATGDDVMLGIPGSGFSSRVVVQIAGVTYTHWTQPSLEVSGATLITLKVKRTALQGVKQLTVSQGFAPPVILPLPDLTPEPPPQNKRQARRK